MFSEQLQWSTDKSNTLFKRDHILRKSNKYGGRFDYVRFNLTITRRPL